MIEKGIDRESGVTLYVQIYGIIRKMIEDGQWQPNSIIPSEDELCKLFLVSKATIRLALADLVRDGFLRRQQGKGTYVKSPLPHSGLMMKTHLSDGMFPDGTIGAREFLTSGILEPSADVREYLKFSGAVFYVQCRGTVDGEPVSVEELFLPLIYFPGIDERQICGMSFFDLVKERSIRKPCRMVQTVEVCHVAGETAGLLKVQDGHPAIAMRRIFIDAEEKPVAYIRLFGRDEKYQVHTEFEKIK
ncbi:MAG TPA: GntR family transcriptional regulator [Dissulfurispiraceae bacterium]|nr:GntR family transcriptional regulator [Dissulfurispiraceae bacterium]